MFLTVLHRQGFHTLQGPMSHVLGLNSMEHIMTSFLRRLELLKECESCIFATLLIIMYLTKFLMKNKVFPHYSVT